MVGNVLSGFVRLCFQYGKKVCLGIADVIKRHIKATVNTLLFVCHVVQGRQLLGLPVYFPTQQAGYRW